MTDKRRGWLAELEAGDLVIIEYPRSSSTVKKVDKITPTGRINIESYVFNQNGLAMGGIIPHHVWHNTVPRHIKKSKIIEKEMFWHWN